MIRTIQYLLVAVIIVMIIGCSSQIQQIKYGSTKKPSWVDSGNHPAYPDSLFILGIGLANLSGDAVKDRSFADANALGEITKQIRARIKVKDIHIILEQAQSGKSLDVTVKDSSLSVSEICSDLVLQGLSFVERYTDSDAGIFYSLAALDRKRAASALRDELETLRIYYLACIEQIDTLSSQYRFLRALWYAKEADMAQNLSTERLEVARFVLAPLHLKGMDWMESIDSPIRAFVKAETILSGLVLEKEGGDNQTVVSGSVPKDPFKAGLYFFQYDKKYPVGGALINFKFIQGKGNLLDRGYTNREGSVLSTVYMLEPSTKPFYEVSAAVDFSSVIENQKYLPESWQSLIRSAEKEVVFRIKLETESIESKAQTLALSLAKGLPDDCIWPFHLAMSNLTYQDERISSSFLNYFQDELEMRLSQLLQFQVIKGEEIQTKIKTRSINEGPKSIPDTQEGLKEFTKADGVLVGKCWERGDSLISIIAEIIENSSKAALSSSSVSILREQIPSKLSLLPKNYLTVQENMEVWNDLYPPDGKLNIKIWVDRMDGGVYKESEKIQAYVWANKDCYLKLIYHDAAGNDLLIFPNDYRQDNQIIGNMSYPIPGKSDHFDLTVVQPCGVEILKAFACTHPMPELQGDTVSSSGIKRLKLSPSKLAETLRSIRVDERPESATSVTSDSSLSEALEYSEASCVVTTVRR